MERKNFSLITALLFTLVSVLASGQTLHLYGGRNHDDYLGCMNCNKYEQNSIWNAYGTYGSAYNTKSIWNSYGTYGDKYNNYSPWNSYSDNSPVVVDNDGNFYGYFSVNKYRAKRADFKLALIIYENHDSIKNDVAGWYDKIFD